MIHFFKKIVTALQFSQDTKVCLNNDLVTHRFYYVEDWDLNEKNNNHMPFVETSDKKDKVHDKKFLKNCYFAKFVSNF